ncbi:MAG: tyrosine--tRNA ligase [Chloroflexi bacterium]|nr:MAG: tyrosine--tRNA ligase [Chloroflexota bacterium]RLT34256.1 MAG: tyrosine--tRNA ligase [Chloroflexota bacterium]
MIPEELLTRGVAEIIVESELRAKLNAGKKLRLKQGFDPSRPDMHIGHAVGLRKLKKFQELGHTIVLIVGDWTAQIGDPSGRDVTRPRLTAEKVRENALTYMEQFFRVIDRDKTEVRWQSEWFGTFKLENALDLAGRFTLAHMLSHDTFRKRYEAGAPLTILELMYPMLQGYDSVAIKADVEFGGTDQKFNNLAGRELQSQMGLQPQDVFLLPLIPGTDGRKMGKSFDNTVDILLSPEDMFGKVMSMADDVMPLYFEVLTDVPMADITEFRHILSTGQGNPMDIKKLLAGHVVTQFISADAAIRGRESFERQFQRREVPDEMPEYAISQPTAILDVLVASNLASSKSEARRLVDGGGVKVNGEKVAGYDTLVAPVAVIQKGRHYVRITAAS